MKFAFLRRNWRICNEKGFDEEIPKRFKSESFPVPVTFFADYILHVFDYFNRGCGGACYSRNRAKSGRKRFGRRTDYNLYSVYRRTDK